MSNPVNKRPFSTFYLWQTPPNSSLSIKTIAIARGCTIIENSCDVEGTHLQYFITSSCPTVHWFIFSSLLVVAFQWTHSLFFKLRNRTFKSFFQSLITITAQLNELYQLSAFQFLTQYNNHN